MADEIRLGGYAIPLDVWNAIYGFALNVGHVPSPFKEGDSCWKLALYLGIAACESNFNMAAEGDESVDQYSGAAATCCQYMKCLYNIVCSSDPYETAWDRARAHAPYGTHGACLSHGVYQLYVCGQGSAYVCDPARLHELGLHMSIALPHIENAINTYWSDANVEQSCRTCTQASGHPGWCDDYDPRVTKIWNATRIIQPDLYAFLLGGAPPSAVKVTLYEHTYYGGRAVVFTANEPNFGSVDFNDAASSIKLEGGNPSATLYQHTNYGGASITFTRDTPDFNLFPMGGGQSWNDQASSIKIGAPEPDPGPAPGPASPSPLPPIPGGGLGRYPVPPIL